MTWTNMVVDTVIDVGIIGKAGFIQQTMPCRLYARWAESTGLLWLECVEAEPNLEFSINMLSTENLENFYDVLTEEIARRFF